MSFKNEYVPPHDKEGAIEFIRQSLAEARSAAEPRQFPHPLEHYSAHEHRLTEFVIDAREKLHLGYSVWDMWTIDHEREMVLVHLGWPRRDPEDDPNECSWEFIDKKGRYRLNTTELLDKEISPGELAATYRINYFSSSRLGHGHSTPDDESLAHIKEAVCEYHRYRLFNFNAYPKTHITLIDGSQSNKQEPVEFVLDTKNIPRGIRWLPHKMAGIKERNVRLFMLLPEIYAASLLGIGYAITFLGLIIEIDPDHQHILRTATYTVACLALIRLFTEIRNDYELSELGMSMEKFKNKNLDVRRAAISITIHAWGVRYVATASLAGLLVYICSNNV